MKKIICLIIRSFAIYLLIIISLYIFALLTWSNPMNILELTKIKFFSFGFIFSALATSLKLLKDRSDSRPATSKLPVPLGISLVFLILLAIIGTLTVLNND